MRGKHISQRETIILERIIPAHAGQTDPPWIVLKFIEDHPRTCGANDPHLHPREIGLGSSPHMRGKLTGQVQPGTRLRIIPAHAGQTRLARIVLNLSTDHPRTCGANGVCDTVFRGNGGSSPHMRGKLVGEGEQLRAPRIIPAHAGQT